MRHSSKLLEALREFAAHIDASKEPANYALEKCVSVNRRFADLGLCPYPTALVKAGLVRAELYTLQTYHCWLTDEALFVLGRMPEEVSIALHELQNVDGVISNSRRAGMVDVLVDLRWASGVSNGAAWSYIVKRALQWAHADIESGRARQSNGLLVWVAKYTTPAQHVAAGVAAYVAAAAEGRL